MDLSSRPYSQGPKTRSPNYFRNCLCLTLIELIKREWPQNWPSLLSELFEIANKSLEQRDLVLCTFKYIAEEFVASEASSTPIQRRKDINQYMNANMEVIFSFFLDSLEYSFNALKVAGNTTPGRCTISQHTFCKH